MTAATTNHIRKPTLEEAAVARGAALLDRRYPGWASLDPDTLDVSDGTTCPLAQASRKFFTAALEELGMWNDWERCRLHGFIPNYALGYSSGRLNAAWRMEVERRMQRSGR